MLNISFIFTAAFPLGKVAGAAVLGGLKIPHGQQQSEIFLVAPHHDGTKQGRSEMLHGPSKVEARCFMDCKYVFSTKHFSLKLNFSLLNSTSIRTLGFGKHIRRHEVMVVFSGWKQLEHFYDRLIWIILTHVSADHDVNERIGWVYFTSQLFQLTIGCITLMLN